MKETESVVNPLSPGICPKWASYNMAVD